MTTRTTINHTATQSETGHLQKKSTANDQKIIPFLWFDGKAEEAMNFYLSAFKNSKAESIIRYGESGPGPAGSVMSTIFTLEGQYFYALNGGPEFTFTPASSFYVSCKNLQEIKRLWKKLSEGGSVMMELGKYPFSLQYGWLQDQFGVSWQLILSSDTPQITPFFMFCGDQQGKAEQAMNFYTSVFKNSGIIHIVRYNEKDVGQAGAVIHAKFSLSGQNFMAMDSAISQDFSFSPALSYFVNCKTQREIDGLWEKLTEGGEEIQCGWLKDKFGVTWQIVPTVLGELLNDPNPEKSSRVMQAMLQMVKIDISALKKAYNQH
ncbi:MAG: VOC family protein [Bacteroidota bacterium]|nr:VOC family protein [Bacteroidota bacterium]